MRHHHFQVQQHYYLLPLHHASLDELNFLLSLHEDRFLAYYYVISPDDDFIWLAFITTDSFTPTLLSRTINNTYKIPIVFDDPENSIFYPFVVSLKFIYSLWFYTLDMSVTFSMIPEDIFRIKCPHFESYYNYISTNNQTYNILINYPSFYTPIPHFKGDPSIFFYSFNPINFDFPIFDGSQFFFEKISSYEGYVENKIENNLIVAFHEKQYMRDIHKTFIDPAPIALFNKSTQSIVTNFLFLNMILNPYNFALDGIHINLNNITENLDFEDTLFFNEDTNTNFFHKMKPTIMTYYPQESNYPLFNNKNSK